MTVKVDGKEPATVEINSPRDRIIVRVRPGKHTLEVSKDGFAADVQKFEIARNGKKELTARLLPKDSPVDTAESDRDADRRVAEFMPLADKEKPFVLVRAGGAKREEFKHFAEVLAVLQDGDKIEVFGNGPFKVPHVDIANKGLILKAGPGYRPRFLPSEVLHSSGIWFALQNAAGEIEGCDFVWSSGTALWGSGTRWEIRNCRFLQSGGAAALAALNGGKLTITDSMLFVEGLGNLFLHMVGVNELEVRNNIISAAVDKPTIVLNPNAPNPRIVRLQDNTILAGGGGLIWFSHIANQGGMGTTVDVSGNLFPVFSIGLAKPPEELGVRWIGSNNLYTAATPYLAGGNRASSLAAIIAPDGGAKSIDSLAAWNQFWGREEEGSREGPSVRFLWQEVRRQEPEAAIQSFRSITDTLRQEHRYRLGDDFGPDWDLVGPGVAYVRALAAEGKPVAGLFTKTSSTPTGTSSVATPFHNTGQTRVQSGVLRLAFGGSSSGNYQTDSGATLVFDALTHSLNAGASITGDGITSIDGATLSITESVTAENLTLDSGTISGPGTMSITGILDWNAGVMSNTNGSTNIAAGAMLNISGNANKVLDGRTLNNGGTLNWSGAGDIDLSNSAVINNLAGATFNIQNDETLFATGTVTNAGLLTKTGGIGTTTIESGVTFSNNGGSVTVQSGTLRFDGTYVQNSGSTTVGAGAVLLTGGRTNILGGTFGGRGSITGNVSKSGTVSPGASPGVLTINGNYEQTAIGTLAIEITGVDGAAFDQLHVLGTATLAGTLEIFRPGGFEPAQGDAFLILTFTSRNGSFATTNGTAINGSISFQPNLGANDLTLDVVNNSPIADLSISITDTPDPVTAGSSFAYTAVITNQGPNDVTNVTLTDPLPAGVSLRAATSTHGICTGTVVISCALGTLHPGETAVVTMVVMPGAAGELINTVTVESDITDSEPADNSAFAVTMVAAAPPADVTGPRVVALEQVPASSTTIRQIVLTVDEALRNASVLPIGNYTLRSAGRDGVFETADDKNMPLVSAEYDPDFLTIALTPRKPLKLNQLLQLTVKGTGGVTDRASNPLDGDSNGTPGGDFVRRFTSSLPIRTAASRSTRTAVAAATDLILEMAGSSPTRVHESESLHGTAPRAEWSSCRAALSRRR